MPITMHKSVNHLVSVIMPTYNRASIISESIDSVLNQTYKNIELLIIDDNSSDNTENVVSKINDSRVRYLKNIRKKGAQGARNTGLLNSRGDYIAFLDSDDKWLSDKIKIQLDFMQTNNSHFTFTNRIMMYDDGSYRNFKMKIDDLYKNNYIGTFSSIVISKKLQEQAGLLDEDMQSCQDWDYWIKLKEFALPLFIDEYLIYYRIGNYGKISTNNKSVLNGHLAIYNNYILDKKIDKHIKAHHLYRLGLFESDKKKKRYYFKKSFKTYFNYKSIIRYIQNIF